MLTLTRLAEIDEATALGGLLLDQKVPGWAEQVDPDRLRMWSVTGCVVAQSVPVPRFRLLGGSEYVDKLRVLGIGLPDQVRYGFALTAPASFDKEAWYALADSWRRQITARTTPTTVAPANVQEPLTLAV